MRQVPGIRRRIRRGKRPLAIEKGNIAGSRPEELTRITGAHAGVARLVVALLRLVAVEVLLGLLGQLEGVLLRDVGMAVLRHGR